MANGVDPDQMLHFVVYDLVLKLFSLACLSQYLWKIE